MVLLEDLPRCPPPPSNVRKSRLQTSPTLLLPAQSKPQLFPAQTAEGHPNWLPPQLPVDHLNVEMGLGHFLFRITKWLPVLITVKQNHLSTPEDTGGGGDVAAAYFSNPPHPVYSIVC